MRAFTVICLKFTEIRFRTKICTQCISPWKMFLWWAMKVIQIPRPNWMVLAVHLCTHLKVFATSTAVWRSQLSQLPAEICDIYWKNIFLGSNTEQLNYNRKIFLMCSADTGRFPFVYELKRAFTKIVCSPRSGQG